MDTSSWPLSILTNSVFQSLQIITLLPLKVSSREQISRWNVYELGVLWLANLDTWLVTTVEAVMAAPLKGYTLRFESAGIEDDPLLELTSDQVSKAEECTKG